MIRYTETKVPEGFSWTPTGNEIERLEEVFEEWHGQYAIAVSSGTIGLLIALLATGAKGKTIYLPRNTFVAARNVATLVGWNIVYGGIGCFLEPSTTCDIAIPTSMGGYDDEWGNRWKTAKILNPSMKVIHDASHSPFSSIPGADITVISLDYAKPISAGEGGMLLTKSLELAETLRILRNNGRHEGRNVMLGINGHMAPGAAALGLASWNDHRHDSWRWKEAYNKTFSNRIVAGSYLCWLEVLGGEQRATDLRTKLNEAGIESPLMYPSLDNKPSFGENHVILPMHRYMTQQDVERVIKTVKELEK